MAVLILVVCLCLAVGHWLLSPLTAALSPLAEGHLLPWLLLGVLLWLLAAPRESAP